MGAISASPTDEVLERARAEAERLFGAHAALASGPATDPASNGHRLEVPLRAHDRELGVLRLERERPFQRVDVARATVLADFAVRASENARLLAEQARLSEQLVTAEQDERRRLADELHDGAVQSLSGIALMLDAVGAAIDEGRLEEAKRISIRVERTGDGGFDTSVSDDAPGERRRRSFDAIAERARTLNGRLSIDQGADGGTTVHVLLPPYTERR